MIAVLLASGCTETIDGTASLAPNAGRVPAIKRALFDGTALAKLLDQPFQPYPHYSEFGGIDKLGTNWDNGQPPDCIGVVHPMQRVTYASAPIQDTAAEMWVHKGDSVKVDSVQQRRRRVADGPRTPTRYSARSRRSGRSATGPR